MVSIKIWHSQLVCHFFKMGNLLFTLQFMKVVLGCITSHTKKNVVDFQRIMTLFF